MHWKKWLYRSLGRAPDPIRDAVGTVQGAVQRRYVRGRPKVFCIGRNKTGTTSLRALFKKLGYVVGDQHEAVVLAHYNYFDGRFDWLDTYCSTAEFFQDAPFSWPGTYAEVDRRFPGSRFILSVRDDEHQWYESLTRYQTQFVGTSSLPTAEQLKTHPFRAVGLLYDTVRVHGTTDDAPYDEDTMKAHYLAHNAAVRQYFAGRPDDLIEINLARPEDYARLMHFLGRDDTAGGFPRLNRS